LHHLAHWTLPPTSMTGNVNTPAVVTNK
jgi:hypothetical protein